LWLITAFDDVVGFADAVDGRAVAVCVMRVFLRLGCRSSAVWCIREEPAAAADGG
jgi:hypothetical protein